MIVHQKGNWNKNPDHIGEGLPKFDETIRFQVQNQVQAYTHIAMYTHTRTLPETFVHTALSWTTLFEANTDPGYQCLPSTNRQCELHLTMSHTGGTIHLEMILCKCESCTEWTSLQGTVMCIYSTDSRSVLPWVQTAISSIEIYSTPDSIKT